MECRDGMWSMLQPLRELNVKTESRESSVRNTEEWASCDLEVGSLSISWSLCGRSVRARVWPAVVAPWPSASPRHPAMTSQKWGRRPRVAGTCAWTCSWRNRLGPTVGRWNSCQMVLMRLSKMQHSELSSVLEERGGSTCLFCVDFDLVVGRGDDDVLWREVSHVNCELVWVTEGLDISSPT